MGGYGQPVDGAYEALVHLGASGEVRILFVWIWNVVNGVSVVVGCHGGCMITIYKYESGICVLN